MTTKEKAEAVVDGFTRDITLERRRWPWPPVTLTLSEEVVAAILEIAADHPGDNAKLIGLSTTNCCKKPMVIVHLFLTRRRPVFAPRVRTTLHICSACGNVAVT